MLLGKHDHQGEGCPVYDTDEAEGYLYIAGPMTGKKDFNFTAFNSAAKYLRAQGYSVVNPAENFNGQQDLLWKVYLRLAIKQVADAGTIVLLAGWEKSEGVALELSVARALQLNITHLYEYDE